MLLLWWHEASEKKKLKLGQPHPELRALPVALGAMCWKGNILQPGTSTFSSQAASRLLFNCVSVRELTRKRLAYKTFCDQNFTPPTSLDSSVPLCVALPGLRTKGLWILELNPRVNLHLFTVHNGIIPQLW